MKNPIVICGAGGLGREILTWVKDLPGWEVVGFVDDHVPRDTKINNMPVLGPIAKLNDFKTAVSVVMAIGNPVVKQGLRNVIVNPLVSFPILIHPSAIILDRSRVQFADGVVVCAGCVITTDIRVGKFVLFNLLCTVGHDSIIEDYSSIMPGVNIAGNVTIGKTVLIGSGANILNNVTIEGESIVGMGAVVTKNVASHQTVVGVPAKSITK